NTSISGGTLKTSGAGAAIDIQGSVLSNLTIASGSLVGTIGSIFPRGTIANSGTISVSDGDSIRVNGDVTLTGGGKVLMGSSGEIVALTSGSTLINIGNTIAGGFIGQGNSDLNLVNSGTIVGNVASHSMPIATGSAVVSNAGTLEATTQGDAGFGALRLE